MMMHKYGNAIQDGVSLITWIIPLSGRNNKHWHHTDGVFWELAFKPVKRMF